MNIPDQNWQFIVFLKPDDLLRDVPVHFPDMPTSAKQIPVIRLVTVFQRIAVSDAELPCSTALTSGFILIPDNFGDSRIFPDRI